jgi:hypothetical protein
MANRPRHGRSEAVQPSLHASFCEKILILLGLEKKCLRLRLLFMGRELEENDRGLLPGEIQLRLLSLSPTRFCSYRCHCPLQSASDVVSLLNCEGEQRWRGYLFLLETY